MVANANNQISSTFEDIQNDADSMIQNINSSFDPLYTDTEKKFEYLQNYLLSTMSFLSKNSKESLSEIEEVIKKEAKTRKNNHDIFFDKFKNFEKLILKEKKMQQTEIRKMSDKINLVGTNLFNKMIKMPKKEMESLSIITEELDNVENNIDEVENKLDDTCNFLTNEIQESNLRLTEIYSSLETQKNEMLNSLNFIEKYIHILEPKKIDDKSQIKRIVDQKTYE